MPAQVPYKRIATEEAWVTEEIFQRGQKLIEQGMPDEPGFMSMWRQIGALDLLVRRLHDVGEGRIRDMDELGIDKQLLLLTAPGVQIFDAATGTALAADSNDQLAEAIARHPDRLDGLAAVAPQDPAAAAREIERAVQKLNLRGVVINSHTRGEYLDDPKFWPIFEAAEANDAPIYIHPRTPAPAMLQPYLERHLEMGIMGFGAEVALHTLAIMLSGALDRFPDLKIVIGHAGEGLPYWLYRIDLMSRIPGIADSYRNQRLPSEYMRDNVLITTSGVPWAPAITMAISVLGIDQVLYAMDYPYQVHAEEVTMTDDFPISDADKMKLFQGNAERIFHLNA